MAWKNVSTCRRLDLDVEATVDLEDEFSETELLQALINAGWINRAEAEAIQQRATAKEQDKKPIPGLGSPIDWDELLESRDWLARRRYDEAAIHLEAALGRDWYGVLSRRAP